MLRGRVAGKDFVELGRDANESGAFADLFEGLGADVGAR